MAFEHGFTLSVFLLSPLRDTPRDLGTGYPKTRGYPNHCDTASAEKRVRRTGACHRPNLWPFIAFQCALVGEHFSSSYRRGRSALRIELYGCDLING